jgi:hypothetical protein
MQYLKMQYSTLKGVVERPIQSVDNFLIYFWGAGLKIVGFSSFQHLKIFQFIK